MISKRTSELFYSITALSVLFALYYVRMIKLFTANDTLWILLFMLFILVNSTARHNVSSDIGIVTSLILILDMLDYTDIVFVLLFAIVVVILPIAILISFIADMIYYNSLSDKEKAAVKIAKKYNIPVDSANLKKIIDMTDTNKKFQGEFYK